MKIQEYVDLIKEINDKNSVEWDSATATLAIYKFLKSPALADYYTNLELRRDDNGSPIICEFDKISKTSTKSVGRFSYGYTDNTSDSELQPMSFKMNLNGEKPRELIRPSTNEMRTEMVKIREKFLNSNSFAEFIEGIDLNNPDLFNKSLIEESKLDFKIKKLIKLASLCNTIKDDPDYADDHVKLETLMALVSDTYKFASYGAQAMVKPILNIMENKQNLSSHAVFSNLSKLASYDNIGSDSYYFDRRDVDEQINYFKKIAQMPGVKDETLFGVVMNNPHDVINKIADTFVFNDLKKLALMQTRYAIKSPTLEEMLTSRPIVDEIYQEAVRRHPLLEQSMADRFEHFVLKDSEYDLKGQNKISFSTVMDNVELYGEDDKHYYLTLQPEILAYPVGGSVIMNDQPYERRYGHDGIGPYYVAFSMERNFTEDVKALYIEKIFIARNLEDNYVEKMFENLMQECMVRKIALVFEQTNFHNVIGSRRMEIFNEVRDKYNDILPVFTLNTDLSHYRSIRETDLKFQEILKIQETLRTIENKKGFCLGTSDCREQVEKFQNVRHVEKKNINKI